MQPDPAVFDLLLDQSYSNAAPMGVENPSAASPGFPDSWDFLGLENDHLLQEPQVVASTSGQITEGIPQTGLAPIDNTDSLRRLTTLGHQPASPSKTAPVVVVSNTHSEKRHIACKRRDSCRSSVPIRPSQNPRHGPPWRDTTSNLQSMQKRLTGRGSSALHLSAEKGHLSVTTYLLNAGMDANLPDSRGQTSLHIAAYHGQVQVMSILLQHGADTEIVDDNGFTALHTAVYQGHESAVRFLVMHGADIAAEVPNVSTSCD